jgi:hypothetical protein
MKTYEIESWAWRVIEAVKAGRPSEDSFVELKSEWPSAPRKVARQIGGHANAARGEPILWLVGIDEKEGVKGVDNFEVSNWYSAVRAEFNGVAPQLTSVNLQVDGKVVVAILFTTDSPPYVVRNATYGTSGGGSVRFEVPWREGNSTTTAGRSELLKILHPIQRLPVCEVRSGLLVAQPSPGGIENWHLTLEIYVIPQSEARTIIPYHHCSAAFELSDHIPLTDLGRVHFTAHKSENSLVRVTRTEVLLDGPGMVYLQGSQKAGMEKDNLPEVAQVYAMFQPANALHSVSFGEALRYQPDEGYSWHAWTLGRPPGLAAMKKKAGVAEGIARANARLRRRDPWKI